MGNAATAADFAGALERFRKNDFLLKQLLVYLGTGEGTNRYPLDPTDYRSWGAPHDPSQWFKDCPVAQQYRAEIDEINKRFDNKQ